jgi:hypothetical protein
VIAGSLIADQEREAVVPVGERAAGGLVDVAAEDTVDVELTAVGRIVSHHQVLQRGLCQLIGCVRQQ